MPRPSPGGALLYVRCFWTAAPPPIGGNCTTRGFDTPATLRKRASCSAKPPSPARRTPGHGGLGRTAHERCQGAAIAQQLARALRQSKTLFAQQQPRRAPWVQNSPSTSCAAHFRYKTLPAHPPSPHIRYKTLPAHPSSPHIRYKTLPAHPSSPHARYKTLPAHPPSPHIRYKTLPAHPKWLDLALFLHAGRVLYRSHHQEAEQGEFCTDCEAELGLATTARHALLVRKAPEEPGGQAAAPVDNGTRPRCGLRPVGRTTPRHPWAAT